ncbi:MAG TPA: response regulator [Lacunisphaera sp.]|nr:response regulator [Lacunisphaera sp.]
MSAAKPEVLVIDDEIQLRRLLRFTLADAGYEVREADSGHAGLVAVAHHQPEMIVLDLGLPDLPGLDVLRRLREWTTIPVLILSVFGREEGKVAALDAGADDYLTKPFGGAELLARLRALQRRTKQVEPANIVSFGSIEVDLVRRIVKKAGHPVKLTAREYALFRLLVTHRGRVLTHRHILREIWGPALETQTHYLRVFMMRLRQKIEDDADSPKYLQTESGIGYRLMGEGS